MRSCGCSKWARFCVPCKMQSYAAHACAAKRDRIWSALWSVKVRGGGRHHGFASRACAEEQLWLHAFAFRHERASKHRDAVALGLHGRAVPTRAISTEGTERSGTVF